jgi:competence protein ComEA
MPILMRFIAAPVALLSLVTTSALALPAAAASAPAATSASAPAPNTHSRPKAKAAPTAPVKLVDINSAGRKELMTLPGIGGAEADKIIAGRPYLTKTELVSKNVLATGPYLSLKPLIVAMPKSKSKPKPAKA